MVKTDKTTAGQATAQDAAGQATAKGTAGQAAVELAVFGAILIFVLGTILNSAIANSYAQNETFKAMRMAMLASWNGSQSDGDGNPKNSIARNSSSILFLEDRLSPEASKYGPLERSPQLNSGSGTLSFQLLYPLDATEVSSNLPVMDDYINGQHFVFTTAAYTTTTLSRADYQWCSGRSPTTAYPLAPKDCKVNQCLRNLREWAGGTVQVSDFYNVIPGPAQAADNANAIMVQLASATSGDIVPEAGSPPQGWVVSNAFKTRGLSQAFIDWFKGTYAPSIKDTRNVGAQVNMVRSILKSHSSQYKLFYTPQVHGTPQFVLTPPTCSSHPCKDLELSSDLVLGNTTNGPTPTGTYPGNNPYGGDLMYDLQRNGLSNQQIQAQFPAPSSGTCPSAADTATIPPLRCVVAWQWSATAAIPDEKGVHIDASNNNYPQYDIDGRLKMVTIYALTGPDPTGSVTVTYEDSSGGDIDSMWDQNSCTPKPGLQNNSQIYTFTAPAGGTPTYLEIKEGQLYNPETGQAVRSVNKRDSVDLIQRMVQLSNNTGRFCTVPATAKSTTSRVSTVDGNPNPVEVCVNSLDGSGNNCFSSQQNFKQTCMDVATNMLYVRSRLEDRRGRFWITNTSGTLKVQ